MVSSSFTMKMTDICRLLATGAMMLMVMSSPVYSYALAGDPWTNPCYGLSATPPSTVSLLDLINLLKTDALTVRQKAADLKTFYTTQQPGESQARVTSTYVSFLDPLHLPNFPYDYEANPNGNLTLIMLNSYKNLSRVAIYCHAMIKNEGACDLKGLALTPMNALKDAVYSALCHVDLTVRKLNSSVTSYENKDAVLPDEIKVVPDTCPAERVFYDYIIFKDTVHYAAELNSLFSDISRKLSSGQ